MSDNRFKKAEFAAWLGILSNIFLAIIKGVIGTIADSKALIADAAHSASDVLGSLAVLVGLKVAQVPPDEDHPYGHGKAESISAIIVAVILFFVGLEVGISSIKSLFSDIHSPGSIAIYGALISIAVKEALFQYKYRLGKKINSQAIIANAWEHRSDVYTSIAALIGISCAIIGGKYEINWLLYLDPIAGALVALLIIKMSYKIGMESIHNTLDHVMHDEDTTEMVNDVREIDGVLEINKFYAREHGHYLIIDIKIAVDPDISVKEGHAIGEQVEYRLLKKNPDVKDVFVHIDPYSKN